MSRPLFFERSIPLNAIAIVDEVSEPLPVDKPSFAFKYLIQKHAHSYPRPKSEQERRAAPYLGFPILVAEMLPLADATDTQEDDDPDWLKALYGDNYVLLAGRPIYEAYKQKGSLMSVVRVQVRVEDETSTARKWIRAEREYFYGLLNAWFCLKQNPVPALLHDDGVTHRDIRLDLDALRYVTTNALSKGPQSKSAREKERARLVGRIAKELRCRKIDARTLMLGSGI